MLAHMSRPLECVRTRFLLLPDLFRNSRTVFCPKLLPKAVDLTFVVKMNTSKMSKEDQCTSGGYLQGQQSSVMAVAGSYTSCT